jgi:prevent-host-death family protein
MATMGTTQQAYFMKTLSAREAKYNFGRLIDSARAEPVVVEKHGRPVVVVLSVEEYERLKAIESEKAAA